MKKKTVELKPGDVVLFGDLRDVVTGIELPKPPCVVVKVYVERRGRAEFFYAGIESEQIVEDVK